MLEVVGLIQYFQTIESILKHNLDVLITSIFVYFQTIESILKLRKYKLECIKGHPFPDYWVYFKASFKFLTTFLKILFPDYWVYFKARPTAVGDNALLGFPDYWVYFKASPWIGSGVNVATFPDYWVYFKAFTIGNDSSWVEENFQTIESILKLV